MRKIICCLFLFLNLLLFKSQSLYFPPLSGPTWDTMAPQRLNWCQPRIDSLYNYLQVKNTKSFIVLKDGKIVLEKYFGNFTVDSVFYWASASKSLASFITGIAQEKGFIDIDNPVSQYIGTGWTSAPLAKENQIRVKHLLEMTSGLDDSPPPPCDDLDTAKTCLLYQTDVDLRWAYHTGPYRKVQDVVSNAAGLGYNLVTNSWVKNKIGMGGVWIDQIYYSKARDMARFGLVAMNKGIWSSDTLLKDSVYLNAMVATSQTMNPAYGYLWWLNGKQSYLTPGLQFSFSGFLIPNAPADMYCAMGKNDQKIYIVPSQGIVVVRQGNAAEAPTFALSNFDNNLWDYINKLSCTTLGIYEPINVGDVFIAPNPSSGFISIKANVKLKRVMLIDLFGKECPIKILDDNTLDVSALAKGSYVLQLHFANDTYCYKKMILN